jgi:hypothetical protein
MFITCQLPLDGDRVSQHIKLNHSTPVHVGYAPSVPDDSFCTPDDLAKLLIYDRRFVMDKWGRDSAPPLSEAAITKLVNLVFYASLFPEEGRFSRFKVSTGAVFPVAELCDVPLESPNDLRRLAPACTNPECVLRVVERGVGELSMNGVVNLGPMGLEWTPGYPGASGVGNIPMYQLMVRGPGHIVARTSGGGSFVTLQPLARKSGCSAHVRLALSVAA